MSDFNLKKKCNGWEMEISYLEQDAMTDEPLIKPYFSCVFIPKQFVDSPDAERYAEAYYITSELVEERAPGIMNVYQSQRGKWKAFYCLFRGILKRFSEGEECILFNPPTGEIIWSGTGNGLMAVGEKHECINTKKTRNNRRNDFSGSTSYCCEYCQC